MFIVQLIGRVPAAPRIIHGEDRLQRDTATVGMSPAASGAIHAMIQAFITGPLTIRLGERHILLPSMMADAEGCVLLALAVQGWMMVPILVLSAAGGGQPSRKASTSGQQGALQGTLPSLADLAPSWSRLLLQRSILRWIVGAALRLVCLPLFRRAFAPTV